VATRSPGETGRSVGYAPNLSLAPRRASFFNSTAEKQGEAALWPVVAAGIAVDAGSTAHLAHDDNQSGFEQPAPVQVVPNRLTRMIDLALGVVLAGPRAAAWSRRGRVIDPKSDRPPARNTSRRLVPSQAGGRCPRIRSMAALTSSSGDAGWFAEC
jgi:hypothetical protein